MHPGPGLQAQRRRRPVSRRPVLLHPARPEAALDGGGLRGTPAGDLRLRLQRPAVLHRHPFAAERLRLRPAAHRDRPGGAARRGLHRRHQAHRRGLRPAGADQDPGLHRRHPVRHRQPDRARPGNAGNHRQERLRPRPGVRRPARQRHRDGRQAWRLRQRGRPGQRAERRRGRRRAPSGGTGRGPGLQRVPRHLRDLHLHRPADPALGLLHPGLRRRRHRPHPELPGRGGRRLGPGVRQRGPVAVRLHLHPLQLLPGREQPAVPQPQPPGADRLPRAGAGPGGLELGAGPVHRVRLRRHHHDLPGLRQPDGPGPAVQGRPAGDARL